MSTNVTKDTGMLQRKFIVPALITFISSFLLGTGMYLVLMRGTSVSLLQYTTPRAHKEDQQTPTTTSPDIHIGDTLGAFTVTAVTLCNTEDDTDGADDVCGITTTGTAEFEGSFFRSGYFDEYCFYVDLKKQINKKALVLPHRDSVSATHHTFCFTEDIRDVIPDAYIVSEFDTMSKATTIVVKNYHFDMRQMGVIDNAVFVGIK